MLDFSYSYELNELINKQTQTLTEIVPTPQKYNLSIVNDPNIKVIKIDDKTVFHK
jgi:hypothetical protein